MTKPRSQQNGDNDFQICDVRQSWHVPYRLSDTYSSDNTGTVFYRFNSKGFRGDEYDPDADFHICVFGESNAFGTGVGEEYTFGYRLKTYIAEVLQCDLSQVNLLNFGVAGVSADHCVRSVFRQLRGQKMDLVICHLPSLQRREYFDGKLYRSLVVPGEDLSDERLAMMPAPLMGFCEMYTPPLGQIDYIKNMLLLQDFLKSKDIPFLISSQFMPKNKGERPYLWPFYQHLDPDHLHHHRWFVEKPDLGADGRHPGARSHVACAISLLQSYAKLQESLGNETHAKLLKKKFRDLKENDPDWKFCNQVVETRRMAKKTSGNVDPA